MKKGKKQMKRISPKVKKLFYVTNIFLLLPFIAYYVGFMLIVGNIERIAIGIPCGILLVALIVWLMIYPSLYYKNYRYDFDKDRIFISLGVIFKRQIVIPVIQIQDIHSYEGPIMQLLHLKSVIISTAGSNFTINYLIIEAAKELTDSLEYGLNKKLRKNENSTDEEVQ